MCAFFDRHVMRLDKIPLATERTLVRHTRMVLAQDYMLAKTTQGKSFALVTVVVRADVFGARSRPIVRNGGAERQDSAISVASGPIFVAPKGDHEVSLIDFSHGHRPPWTQWEYIQLTDFRTHTLFL